MRFQSLQKLLIIVFLVLFVSSCKSDTSGDPIVVTDEYSSRILMERTEKDFHLKNDKFSPFNQDPEAKFVNLNYFQPDTSFIFKSKFYRFEIQDTIIILGTKGEKRNVIREGYINIIFRNQEHKLNIYKGFGPNGEPYHSIWFTDETSGNETYGVGRYLDFKMNPDENFEYVLDFNKLYNPYCAYSSKFSCPIPSKDDHLKIEVKAGETNFK